MISWKTEGIDRTQLVLGVEQGVHTGRCRECMRGGGGSGCRLI